MDAAFFDHAYYRLLEPFHTEEDARYETASLRELLGLAQSDRILDLGCGWGRHLALLGEAGHHVTGVDLSLELLGRARRASEDRIDSESPAAASSPAADLVAGDMRRLPLADRSFDVVINLATSLGLFLDDQDAVKALQEAHRVLRPRGRLLVEGMHRADVEAAFAERDGWTLDDGTEVRARRRWDPDRGVSHEVLRWDGPAGSGAKRHSLRVRNRDEMVGLVTEAGFSTTTTYGDWGGSGFHQGAPRLIVVADRR